MNNEYVIINKTAIEKRIEELIEKANTYKKEELEIMYIGCQFQIKVYKEILSQSTPLIPEIEKAIDFGKDYIREHSYIAEDWNNTPIIEYHDSTEETNKYISNLKLDI